MSVNRRENSYTYGKSNEANEFMEGRLIELELENKKQYHEYLFRLDGFKGKFSHNGDKPLSEKASIY